MRGKDEEFWKRIKEWDVKLVWWKRGWKRRNEMGDEVDSDHQSVTVWLGKGEEGKGDEEEWVKRVD